MVNGFIFDFNGTLFFDHDINYRAWKEIYHQITNDNQSFDELYEMYKSSGNYAFIKELLTLSEKECNDNTINLWSNKKESIYQKIAISENRTFLSPGSQQFLDWLVNNNQSVNLASCSVEMNVDFYYRYFGIGKWFNRNLIVCSGKSTRKSEMYIKACENIGCSINNCIIIEDSLSCIDEAIEAGCNKIIYVNSRNIQSTKKEIIQTINDFNEIDLEKIKSLLGINNKK